MPHEILRRRLAAVFGWRGVCVAVVLFLGLQVISGLLDRKGHRLAYPPVLTHEIGDVDYGDPRAPVTILALVSATCVHCRAWETSQLPLLTGGLVAQGRARLVLRPFPLDRAALSAAALIACLPEADRVSVSRSLLAVEPREWVLGGTTALARAAGLTGQVAVSMAACANGSDIQDRIMEGAREAQRSWAIRGTPTFVVGNRVAPGALPENRIRQMVSEAGAP